MRSSRHLLSCVVFSALLLAYSCPLLAAGDGTVTLDVQNMSIEEVLKMIADQSEMSVVLSTNVTGNVTVKFDKVTVVQALDSVLKANNYLYSVSDGIITVYSYQDTLQQERFASLQTKVITLGYTDVADLTRILLSMKTARGRIETNAKSNQVIITDTPEKVKEVEEALKQLDQPTEIKKYKLLYSKAKDMEDKLTQLIPKEKGDVYIDERTNTIVVRATPVILNNVDSFIEGWDSQHKQVMIEAMIMEVTLDDTTKLGIEWEHAYDRTGEDPHHNPGALDLLTDFGLNLATGGTGGIYKIGGLTPDEYSITIEALKSDANTEVLSSPRIVVIDGESANILVGSSEPYAVATTDPVTKLLVQDIKYVDVGIKLEVTPQIGEDNFVTMKIHPEVSTARRVAEVDNVVAKDTTQADTTMMVKDGETIILGGLIKNDKKQTINKVPFLGDIPLLGLAFQNRSYQDVKKEVLVFITPHILTTDNRQNISRQEYQDSVDRTKRIDPMIETAIEKSGGVQLTPPQTEKRSEAMQKDLMRILDMRE
ncbi:MAG: secretin N-terminal domain-containing protein [Candidatus Omnitrophota bacterium]